MMNRGAEVAMDHANADGSKDKLFYSPFNMGHNARVVAESRQFFSILGGCVAGILGFEGLMGLFAYLATQAVLALALVFMCKFQIGVYYFSWRHISVDGIMDGGMSFLLFWTLMRNIVHVY